MFCQQLHQKTGQLQFENMGAGFYKKDVNGVWMYAENKVLFPSGIELKRENHSEHVYPVDGWVWYDTAPEEYVLWFNKKMK